MNNHRNRLLIQRDGYIQSIYLPMKTVKRIHAIHRKDAQRAAQQHRRQPRTQAKELPTLMYQKQGNLLAMLTSLSFGRQGT